MLVCALMEVSSVIQKQQNRIEFNQISFNLIHTLLDSSTVLILFQMSPCFLIPLARLELCFGIKGKAIRCLSSYLKDKTFCVSVAQFFSYPAPVFCRIPQSYLVPLGNISRRYNTFHFYADDLQLYLLLKSQDSLQLLL